jgi:hypothetical protein
METALVGLLGVIVGVLINEILRRKSRIESYASRVFDKRLEIYEGLYERVAACSEIANNVTRNKDYSFEERLIAVSDGVHSIVEWCDIYNMYLNDEIVVHCCPLLMGMENVYDLEDETEKKIALERFYKNLRNAKEMIRKESGVEDINKLFSKITKAKHSSPIIKYYREKKKMGNRD